VQQDVLLLHITHRTKCTVSLSKCSGTFGGKDPSFNYILSLFHLFEKLRRVVDKWNRWLDISGRTILDPASTDRLKEESLTGDEEAAAVLVGVGIIRVN
jgi:hypothetical protein